MQSVLITGATTPEREEKAKTFVDASVSQFDITALKNDVLSISDIRALIRFIGLKPISSKKFAIIHEAQTLTLEAQNALLKTLEEPPENTTIILTCPNSQLLLPTIVSRCQVIELPNIKNMLTSDQLSAPIQSGSTLNSQLSTLVNGGVGERLKLAQDLSKNKEQAINWLEKMIIYVRQKLIADITNTRSDSNLTIEQLSSCLNAFQKAHIILKTTNVNPRLTLENFLLNLP